MIGKQNRDREGYFKLDGEYPAIPTLQGGVKGYNIKETPCRKAPPFGAESFNLDPGARGTESTRKDPFVFNERGKRYV
jgi:hypothetical protein